MTSKMFFRWLWRFNAVAIASVALMALAYGALAGVFIARDVLKIRNVAGVAPARSPEQTQAGKTDVSGNESTLVPSGFSRIPGHDTLWSALRSRDRMTTSYYSKEATNTRDYVFYDMAAGTYHRLLDRDDALITSTAFLAPPLAGTDAQGAASAWSNPATAALLITIIDKDSNGDGRLSDSDDKTIAIATPGGSGLKTLLTGVDEFLGHTVSRDGTATLMLRDHAGRTRALRVVLSDFKVDRDDAYTVGAPPPG